MKYFTAFAVLLHNCQNLLFLSAGWELTMNSRHFRDFLEISDAKSEVVRQLVRHLVYSLFGFW